MVVTQYEKLQNRKTDPANNADPANKTDPTNQIKHKALCFESL